ncbi:MAG: transcriptional regulator [Alphaproteobacteria bacterium]|jgi:ribosome-binding protein aMBF1 (putative translation factor)|nr:transcriptional regulator [Alphaproteobacteria bacterium]
MNNSVRFEDIKNQWMKDAEFRKAYHNMKLEYEIALELIKARMDACFTQEDVAARMGTTQSVIARLESGRVLPSVKTLSQYAKATGNHLHVSLKA